MPAARFVPSMRQRLDLEKIYRRALRIIPDTIDGTLPLPLLAATCPMTLDELLNGMSASILSLLPGSNI